MQEYTLYLDESRNYDKTYVTVSGIIVKNSDIEIIDTGISEAKLCIWDKNYIEKNTPTLHCVDLTTLKNYSYNPKNKVLSKRLDLAHDYSIFKNTDASDIKSKYNNVHSRLCKILREINSTIIGCLIDYNKFQYLYGDQAEKIESELFVEVAMQETIENYAHFLYKNNGIGSIVYESRTGIDAYTNRSLDFKMYDNFCKIKSGNKGISFINQDKLSKTIRYLNIHSKKENIAGLQLADFIAYHIAAMKPFWASKCNYKNEKALQTQPEFQRKIYERLYNGNYSLAEKDLRSYFGMKYLPYDFEYLEDLRNEHSKLSKAYDNLKTERNKLNRKNKELQAHKDNLIKEKSELAEENRKLKEKLEILLKNRPE